MRVVYRDKVIRKFFNSLKTKNNLTWGELALVSDVSERTLRDWYSGRYTADFKVIKRLSKKGNLNLPQEVKILPDNWSKKESGRKGAVVRYKKYGNPGTLEGRRKGGKKSVKALCICKSINYPNKSRDLAEFIGIVLGDGNITSYQVKIYFNSEDDKDYIKFVNKLIKKLFDISPSCYKHKQKKLSVLVISRKNLVDFLVKQGLLIGNKVKQGITIPEWIMKDISFSQSVARGLMDTDGSVFNEHHRYKDKVYSYKVLTFANYSYPLIKQYKEILKKLGIKVIINDSERLSIRTEEQIKRYISFIGTSNLKHARKLLGFGGVR